MVEPRELHVMTFLRNSFERGRHCCQGHVILSFFLRMMREAGDDCIYLFVTLLLISCYNQSSLNMVENGQRPHTTYFNMFSR